MVPSSELSSHRLDTLNPFRGSPRRRVIHIKTAFGFAQHVCLLIFASDSRTCGGQEHWIRDATVTQLRPAKFLLGRSLRKMSSKSITGGNGWTRR